MCAGRRVWLPFLALWLDSALAAALEFTRQAEWGWQSHRDVSKETNMKRKRGRGAPPFWDICEGKSQLLPPHHRSDIDTSSYWQQQQIPLRMERNVTAVLKRFFRETKWAETFIQNLCKVTDKPLQSSLCLWDRWNFNDKQSRILWYTTYRNKYHFRARDFNARWSISKLPVQRFQNKRFQNKNLH